MDELFGAGRVESIVHSLLADAGERADIVVGRSGMGKSHLLDAVSAADVGRCVVVEVDPAEYEWPFAAVRQVLPILGDEAERRMAPILDGSGGGAREAVPVAQHLVHVLRSLALPPVRVIIDDADTMDPESQCVVAVLARRLHRTGVSLLLSATEVAAEHPLGRIRRIDLPPLGRSESFELAARLAGPAADTATLELIVARTDGVPGAIADVIAACDDEQLRGARHLTPARWPACAPGGDWGADPAQREVLARLCTAPLMRPSALTRADPDLVDALAQLEDGDVVVRTGDYVRIREEGVRRYWYASLPPHERRRRHGEEGLPGEGGLPGEEAPEPDRAARAVDAAVVTWHRSHGIEPPSSILDELVRAAVHLVAEGQPFAATELAERAWAIAAGRDLDARPLSDLAASLLAAGSYALARRYDELALRMPHSRQQHRELARLRTRIDYLLDNRLGAMDLLDVPVDPAEVPGTVEYAELATLWRVERWEAAAARRLVDAANALRDPDAGTGTEVPLGELVEALEGVGSPRRQPAPRTSDAPFALLIEAHLALLRDDLDPARALCAGAAEAPALCSAEMVDRALDLRVRIELRADRFTAARRAIIDWLAVGGSPARPAHCRPWLAWLAHIDGRTDDADAIAAHELARAYDDHGPATLVQLYRVQWEAAMMAGAYDRAISLLESVDGLDRGLRNPGLVRHGPELVAAYAAAGDSSRARDRANSCLARMSRADSGWSALAVARIAAETADDEAAVEAFGSAIEIARRSDRQFEIGRMGLSIADRLDRLDRVGDAAAAESGARDAFRLAGAGGWVSHAEGRLAGRRARDRDRTPAALLGGLDEEARAIVSMVRDGNGTKQIASTLHLAVRTVEARLTMIYRVLGVRSRAELVAGISELSDAG